MNFYTMSEDATLAHFRTSATGLSSSQLHSLQKQFGKNILKHKRAFSPFLLFISQFKNALILLLLFAGLLSFFLDEHIEAIAIFFIILLNAVLGFFQEYRAEKAMEALKKLSSPHAKVIRDGNEQLILSADLVPGDLILLEAGDIVPADARLLEVSSLRTNEASLTGESKSIEKNTSVLPEDTSVPDRTNTVFMNTPVTYGKGKAIVFATGMSTAFGRIASSLGETKAAKTPLQKKFEQLAKQIGFVAVLLVVAVVVLGAFTEVMPFGRLLVFALALIVSTVPNSLPIIVTVSLSLGARRLARKSFLVKHLPAAESLGAATVICTDKTGTLTSNKMTVTTVHVDGATISVSGTGYHPVGSFTSPRHYDEKHLHLLLRVGVLCNTAQLSQQDDSHSIIGDPTEGALLVLAAKKNIDRSSLLKQYSIVKELPFDSDRKMMSVLVEANKKRYAYTKGAPDILLKKCTYVYKNGRKKKLTSAELKRLLAINENYAGRALRVLALAYREVSSKETTVASVEQKLVFLGFVGMIDPPREGVKDAVSVCKRAGIDVLMITGDHPNTAVAVAEQIGISTAEVLTGSDIETLSDIALREKLQTVRVIARALPLQKLCVVHALQYHDHIVAMTGDGVNDAPALKASEIGIAMGITGTDVAKEVADAVLVDDNFATIVRAIEEGRTVYDKMIKSAKYLLSCNSGEILTVFVAMLLRFPLPLVPLQLLLMNLLTDDFPALGLGFEKNEEGIMDRAPRNPREKPISVKLFISIVLFGIIMMIGTLYAFQSYLSVSLSKAQTMAFTTLVFFQLFAVLSSRTFHFSARHLNPFTNLWLLGAVLLSISIQLLVVYVPALQLVFSTVFLAVSDWLLAIGLAFVGFLFMELSKLLFYKKDIY